MQKWIEVSIDVDIPQKQKKKIPWTLKNHGFLIRICSFPVSHFQPCLVFGAADFGSNCDGVFTPVWRFDYTRWKQ